MASESDRSVFQDCCYKIKNLSIADGETLNHLIDQLNSINLSKLRLDNKNVESLLCQIIPLIPQGNDHLLTKFCSLIYLLLHKQERDLSVDCVQKLTEFLISSLQKCGECYLSDVLISFSSVLNDNGNKTDNFHQTLLGKNGLFVNFIHSSKCDKNAQYYTFQCILNLLSKNPDPFTQKEYFDSGYSQYIAVIKNIIDQSPCDLLSIKILISALKCLQFHFGSKNILNDNIGELLGILKCLLFYGLPGPTINDYILYPTLPSPDLKAVEDSQNESDSTYPRLRKQKRVRRTKQKKLAQKKGKAHYQNDEVNNCEGHYEENSECPSSVSSMERTFSDLRIRSSSSDSEYSDVESSSTKIKSHQATVRQTAYQVLQAVVKNTDKKIIFSYWSSFLPDHPALPGITYGQNIFTTILKDPVSQVRLSALVLLTEMLRGSKHFLSFADGKSSRHSSFTSLSSIIATIIEEIHRCLLLALLSESNSLLLTQILKCYAVLCENTPYSKLKDEILLKLLKQVKGFLHHKDSQVQVAALIVFQFIVKSDQIPEAIGDIIISSNFDSAVKELSNSTENHCVSPESKTHKIPWLFRLAEINIFNDEPLPTQIESIQLLSCMVGKYFHKIYSTLSILEDVILFCLNHTDTSLQLHGAKLLDVFGRCVFNASESKMTDEHLLARPNLLCSILSSMLESAKYDTSEVKKLWQNVLNGPFIKNITDSQKSLLSVCCDCLSTVPVDVFEELPEKQQIFYITVLLGLASDSHPNVRGAAVRCLGVYCLFPRLSKDFSFLSDVSEILVKSVDDPYVNVRFKASWSVGKLSDALFENKNSVCIQDQITDKFFYSTAMACVQYCKDSDKVKANSVRALGIFLYHLKKELLVSPKMLPFVKCASSVLQSALSSNTMKVCWNVCYALGKMLKNTELVKSGVIELGEILTDLLNSLKSPNFKVRISAAQALTAVEYRELYGKMFPVIWLQLVEALYSANNDVNFKEINHQENLIDQLCYSLCRLVALITADDLSIICQQTLESSEMLFTSMWKFGLHTSLDKIEDVCNAVDHLSILHGEHEGNIQILPVLQDILNQVAIAFYGQDTK